MCSSENPLREIIQIACPRFAVMGVIIHIPNVRNILLLQINVNALGNAYETILIAAGNIKKLQLLARSGGIGHKLGGRFGVRRGRESSNPRKCVEMRQAEVERLAAAHRWSGQRALLAIPAGGILRLHGGNQTVEQVTLT